MALNRHLDPRLDLIVQILRLLPSTGLHDLACDHGLVAAAYASYFPHKSVYASDIAAQPLRRARTLIEQLHLTNVKCFLSDGIKEHSNLQDYDSVVIAGLSGESIWRILAADPRIAAGDYHERTPLFIIAQPMQLNAKLKLALWLHDFAVLGEVLVEDKGRVQEIILIVNQPYRALDLQQIPLSDLRKFYIDRTGGTILDDKKFWEKLSRWQANLPPHSPIHADLQLIWREAIALTESERKNKEWSYLLALLAIGLQADITFATKKAAPESLPVISRRELAACSCACKKEYAAFLLRFYETKYRYLSTKVCHAPKEEQAFWQSIFRSFSD